MTAPDIPRIGRGDGISARPSQQSREDSGAVERGCAQPDNRAVRTDDGAALTVGDEGVLAQHARLRRGNHPVQVSGSRLAKRRRAACLGCSAGVDGDRPSRRGTSDACSAYRPAACPDPGRAGLFAACALVGGGDRAGDLAARILRPGRRGSGRILAPLVPLVAAGTAGNCQHRLAARPGPGASSCVLARAGLLQLRAQPPAAGHIPAQQPGTGPRPAVGQPLRQARVKGFFALPSPGNSRG
jgi:hypothetical protein